MTNFDRDVLVDISTDLNQTLHELQHCYYLYLFLFIFYIAWTYHCEIKKMLNSDHFYQCHMS